MTRRLRFRRPVFLIEKYRQGLPCGSMKCLVCGNTAIVEFCETLGCQPSELDHWEPRCNDCRDQPLLNWREITENAIRPMLGESFNEATGRWERQSLP